MSVSPRCKRARTDSGQKEDDIRQVAMEHWVDLEVYADKMIPLLGSLYRNRNTLCTLFGNRLVHLSPKDIIKLHYTCARNYDLEISVRETYYVIAAVASVNDVCPMRVDAARTVLMLRAEIDKLSAASKSDEETIAAIAAHLAPQLHAVGVLSPPNLMTQPRDVILYGFGRIGRLLARVLIDKTGSGSKLLLRAVVVRVKGSPAADLEKRASLLRYDSIHGQFNGSITVDTERSALVVNGNFVKFLYHSSPAEIDYTQHGIKDGIVLDNTGAWTTKEGLEKHLRPGVSDVVLTAPGSGVPNIVAGVNSNEITPGQHIYSCASCTTNAIAPVLKVMLDEFGIKSGHVETIHAFTNDQNLTDNYHKKPRRGRSAVMNMVLTSTGAATAVVKCLPALQGVLTANSIRVPTPNVSMAILMLNVNRSTNLEEVNSVLRDSSLNSSLRPQIEYCINREAVSSDFVGSHSAAIVDASATIVKDGKVNLYVWYDNEYGYTCQVVRCVQKLAGIVHPAFPPSTSPHHSASGRA